MYLAHAVEWPRLPKALAVEVAAVSQPRRLAHVGGRAPSPRDRLARGRAGTCSRRAAVELRSRLGGDAAQQVIVPPAKAVGVGWRTSLARDGDRRYVAAPRAEAGEGVSSAPPTRASEAVDHQLVGGAVGAQFNRAHRIAGRRIERGEPTVSVGGVAPAVKDPGAVNRRQSGTSPITADRDVSLTSTSGASLGLKAPQRRLGDRRALAARLGTRMRTSPKRTTCAGTRTWTDAPAPALWASAWKAAAPAEPASRVTRRCRRGLHSGCCWCERRPDSVPRRWRRRPNIGTASTATSERARPALRRRGIGDQGWPRGAAPSGAPALHRSQIACSTASGRVATASIRLATTWSVVTTARSPPTTRRPPTPRASRSWSTRLPRNCSRGRRSTTRTGSTSRGSRSRTPTPAAPAGAGRASPDDRAPFLPPVLRGRCTPMTSRR